MIKQTSVFFNKNEELYYFWDPVLFMTPIGGYSTFGACHSAMLKALESDMKEQYNELNDLTLWD